MEDRAKRARIRSVDAAVARTSRATAAMVGAMMQDGLESDKFATQVATAKYSEAEENLEQALELIRDCRRSVEGRSE